MSKYSFPFPSKNGKIQIVSSPKMLRIAINGYGRIGRNLHRILIGHPDIKVIAINGRTKSPEMRAHLLKYDSLHGVLNAEVKHTEDELIVNGEEVLLWGYPDPLTAPWGEYEIDVVISASGRARTREEADKFITAGAKKVLVSAPMKDDTPTFVFGVNDEGLTPEITIMNNASCTTNSIAAPLKVLDEAIGIENVFITTIHAFTSSQNLLDNSGEDLRRARSAFQNIIPTTSGAMKAIAKVLPALEGKIDGMAFRVPVPTGSVSDMRFVFKRETSREELNDLMRAAAKTPRLKNILDVSDEELVSMDFATNPHSAIIDAPSTKVIQGKYAQMLSWYDNEWGYATRLKDFLERLASFSK